jgi:alpha-glucoside transport system substrate-binding protein
MASTATDRSFSADECARYFPGEQCPDPHLTVPEALVIARGDESYGVTDNVPGALSGATMEALGAWAPDDLGPEIERFENETGIHVSYVSDNPDSEIARRENEGVVLPDIAMTPQPASVLERGQSGALVDLSVFLDVATMRSQLGNYLMDLATVGADGTWPSATGAIYGVPIDVDLKGLVFYPRAVFEAAGYRVPSTWDELTELSQQLIADGEVPWCIGFESQRADGWPGTDWIESLLLREAGPDLYDDWTFHKIRFDDSSVQSAAQRFDHLISPPGAVLLGRGSIRSLHHTFDVLAALLKPDPSCWLLHQADFVLGFAPATTELGVDLDFFVLPPIDASRPIPSTGGGNIAIAFGDRPEVRAFLKYAASPRWGEVWASSPDSEFLSPNTLFDLAAYGADASDSERNLRSSLGTVARDALAAGTWRFDASDLMPSVIGGFADEVPGAFWQGMLDFVDGVRPMDQVLSDIETAWVALEAEEGG